MGWGSPGWHDTFRDLGFNPAPPWTVIGTPLASLVPTEWPLFWIISNSDLPFYLLAFGLIWWAFGLRMAAVMTLWLNCAQLNEARFTGGFSVHWLVSSLACIAFTGAVVGLRGGLELGGDDACLPWLPRLPWAAVPRLTPAGMARRSRSGRLLVPYGGPALAVRRADAVLCFLFTASCVTGRGISNWEQ